jgi:hypothetical protein
MLHCLCPLVQIAGNSLAKSATGKLIISPDPPGNEGKTVWTEGYWRRLPQSNEPKPFGESFLSAPGLTPVPIPGPRPLRATEPGAIARLHRPWDGRKRAKTTPPSPPIQLYRKAADGTMIKIEMDKPITYSPARETLGPLGRSRTIEAQKVLPLHLRL